MLVKNVMEDLVEDALNHQRDHLNIACSCDICRCDMMAISLNMLSPKYVVKEQGEKYAKASMLDRDSLTNVLTAVTKASDIVSKNPSHD